FPMPANFHVNPSMDMAKNRVTNSSMNMGMNTGLMQFHCPRPPQPHLQNFEFSPLPLDNFSPQMTAPASPPPPVHTPDFLDGELGQFRCAPPPAREAGSLV